MTRVEQESIARAKGRGRFVPAPAGTHAAVCVDVIHLGLRRNPITGRDQPKLTLVFELAARMPDGRQFLVSRTLTASLDRSELLAMLTAWLGDGETATALTDFDALVGRPALVRVAHKPRRDGPEVSAVVLCVTRPPAGMRPVQSGGTYVRVRDRRASGPGPGTPDAAP